MDTAYGYSSALKNVSPPPALKDAKQTCQHVIRQIESGVNPEAIADMLAQAAITLREASK